MVFGKTEDRDATKRGLIVERLLHANVWPINFLLIRAFAGTRILRKVRICSFWIIYFLRGSSVLSASCCQPGWFCNAKAEPSLKVITHELALFRSDSWELEYNCGFYS